MQASNSLAFQKVLQMQTITKKAISKAQTNGHTKQSSKPQAQTLALDLIPAELKERGQWLVWRYEQRKGNKTKVPYSPHTRSMASVDDPATLSSFDQAVKTWQQSRGHYHGIGYVFAADDPYCGIDLDKCISNDGAVDPDKLRWIEAFDSYTERTPSDRGFHIIVKGKVEQGHNDQKHGFEIYSSGRYFTFTGHSYHSENLPIAQQQAVIDRFVAEVFAKPKPKPKPTKPKTQISGAVTINDRLQKAFSAKNGARVKALFTGDTSAYGGDDSAADLALCSRLAFWSDGHASILDAMFRQSRLMRDKWDENHYSDGRTYGEETINKALGSVTKFYDWRQREYTTGDNGVGDIHSNGADAEQWEPPAAFYEYDLPEFPIDVLPSWLKAFTIELATATQTPVDLTAMTALTVCAAAVAGNVSIQARQGWIEPLNIFTAVALPPGNRKSSVFAEVAAPLEQYESDRLIEMRDVIARAASEHRILEERRKRLENEAAKADSTKRGAKRQEAISTAQELDRMRVPAEPRLLADDITPERLASMLCEQGGRMAVLSPEATIFDLMAGRYSNGAPNFDVFLKGHAGDALRVDRGNRPAEFVKHPALTVGLAVQPEVIRGLHSKPGFRGRGLVGRFLYIMPVSMLGRRKSNPSPVTVGARNEYTIKVKKLARIEPAQTADSEPTARLLNLTADAEACLCAFIDWLEPQLAEDGALASMTDWAGKLAGAVLRLAGILHLSEHADKPEPWLANVSAETIQRAETIGRYLIPHARAAYAEMGADEQIEAAKFVLRWIERYALVTFTKREAFEGTKGRFRKVAGLEPALDLLEAHGYIRARQEAADLRPGRKPSQRFDVNPYFTSHSHNSHNSHNAHESSNSANCANCANGNHKAIFETSSPCEVHTQ